MKVLDDIKKTILETGLSENIANMMIEVALVDVIDKQSTGRIIIPPFITNTIQSSDVTNANRDVSPFKKSKFREIHIDNRPNITFDATYMCGDMESDRLKITFSNPECLVNMESMLRSCRKLTSVDLSNLNTRNVTDLSRLFNSCENLKRVNLSGFNTSKVNDMFAMFSYCDKLEEIHLNSFDITNVLSMRQMFKACDSLVKLDLSNFNMGNKMLDIDEMFSWCTSLEFIDIQNFNHESIGKYKNTMFYKCDSLKVLKQPESLSKK